MCPEEAVIVAGMEVDGRNARTCAYTDSCLLSLPILIMLAGQSAMPINVISGQEYSYRHRSFLCLPTSSASPRGVRAYRGK